jgi:ABC-type amino acid transport substrate-binding protein
MNGRRRGFALVAAIAAVFLSGSVSLWSDERDPVPRETVKVGIFNLGPFMMPLENGEAGGVAVDYWREVLGPLMGVDVEVSGPYPIPRLEVMLEAGEIDVIPYITKIPARESRFLYPSHPLTKISPCIVVRHDSPLAEITSQEDLYGMKIGFITSAYIPPFLRHERITLDLITATDFRQINHKKLMNGRVDALLDINSVSFRYEMAQLGYLTDLRIILLKQDAVNIYSIFTASPRGENLRARYDSAVSRVTQGTFDGITERYLKHER